MDPEFREFMSEFDHGKYDELFYDQKRRFMEEIDTAKSDITRAKYAAEYGEKAAFLIVECYHDWLKTR